jgi:hypothetical protein
MRLDHDIGRTPDHQQMLDIVAAYENEPPAAIDRCLVDDGKPRAAPPASRWPPNRRTNHTMSATAANTTIKVNSALSANEVSNIAPPPYRCG